MRLVTNATDSLIIMSGHWNSLPRVFFEKCNMHETDIDKIITTNESILQLLAATRVKEDKKKLRTTLYLFSRLTRAPRPISKATLPYLISIYQEKLVNVDVRKDMSTFIYPNTQTEVPQCSDSLNTSVNIIEEKLGAIVLLVEENNGSSIQKLSR